MTATDHFTRETTWVAIDIAKRWNVVLIETPDGKRRRLRMANTRADHDRFIAFLQSQTAPCSVALEPTGVYHRPIAHRLLIEGIEVQLVSSLAVARFREATYGTWDKNDPKDAAVILDLLKQGKTMHYHDPLIAGIHDTQELSNTYMQVALARTRLSHSLQTHYFPLYWPEIQQFWRTERSVWLPELLCTFPVPAAVLKLDQATFVREAWPLVGRKVNKQARLEQIYDLAKETIALPISPDSLAVETFRIQLKQFLALSRQRAEIESLAEHAMAADEDFALLKTIPGIGSVLALTILAEAGDLRRFGHHRQFLKFCGFDLAKAQSGTRKGQEHLSKRGNAHLRRAFWMAGTIASRMKENSFQAKLARYVQHNPLDKDLRRKALTAVAAKMARVAHAVVKTGTPYRVFFEDSVPSGSITISAGR